MACIDNRASPYQWFQKTRYQWLFLDAYTPYIEDGYQKYLLGGKKQIFLDHGQEVDFSRFVVRRSDGTEFKILRKRESSAGEVTSQVSISCQGKNQRGQYIFAITGDKTDCDDVVLSAKFCYMAGEHIESHVVRGAPYIFQLSPQENGWLAICIELTFAPNQILTFPLQDNLVFDIHYQLEVKLSYLRPRIIENQFPSYSPSLLSTVTSEAIQIAREKCDTILTTIITAAQAQIEYKSTCPGIDLYSGLGGWSYFLWKIAASRKYPKQEQEECLKLAKELNNICIEMIDEESFTEAFLTGTSGILAVCSVVNFALGNKKQMQESICQVEKIAELIFSSKHEVEVLYGIAGYMISLLFIMKNIPHDLFDITNMYKILQKCFSALCAGNSPVVQYKFGRSHYFGAGHGLAGVLLVMLHIPKLARHEAYKKKIEDSIELLLRKQKDGMYLCSQENPEVSFQWCHGSPGVVATLLKAHEVYGHEKYINEAISATKQVWKYGLLLKGFGMCHGILGNAYAFLQMYRYTKNEEFLYYASQFCRTQVDSRVLLSIEAHKADEFVENHNLMEGLSGIACFCLDIQEPDTAAFPGYLSDIHSLDIP